ncbi:MAG: hypothetical protein AB8H80_02415 [Planctomycetota bacterium]
MSNATASRKFGLLPAALAVLLGSFTFCERIQRSDHLIATFAAASGGLLLWFVALRLARGKALLTEAIAPVRQHYIQACVQLTLYAYWGYQWVQDGERPIFDQAPLIVAQFVFLYAFDGLWSWSRGRAWRLASGPVPIVLSTNLFIWFRDDVYHWQFAMIIAGLLGKEFLRWNKDGRRTHIFNPSGFGLMCAATALIATDSTGLTWANSLAAELEVQDIFVVLFALGLVVQFFFAVTLMTFAAAVTMILGNLFYTEVTGVYLFASSNLPAAAFLGLMLLMTDPSTSPRTNVGRTAFGIGYGVGYMAFYQLLGSIGAPELYAKLYPVPILNCMVQLLDRMAKTGILGRLNQHWENDLRPGISNAIHMSLWAAVFAVIFFTGYVGDTHPGNSIGFWKKAVAEGRHDAERKLVMVAGSRALAASVPPASRAAAYNELGIQSMTANVDRAPLEARIGSAAKWFARGAEMGSSHAHINVLQHFLANRARISDASLNQALQASQQLAVAGNSHAAFVIGLAVETGVGVEPSPKGALTFYRRCPPTYLFAQKGIARIGLMPSSMLDLRESAQIMQIAAEQADAEACYYLAYMHWLGRGRTRDESRSRDWLQRSAELGFEPALSAQTEAARSGKLPPFQTPRRKHLEYPAWASAFPLAE